MALRVSDWVLFDLANESGYSCLLYYCLHGEPAGELIRTQPKGKGVAGDELKVVWRTLVLASIWAPRSSSSRTMITLPRLEAMCRGVMPFCRGGGVKPMCQRWSGGGEGVKTASQTGGGTLPLAWSWHWRLCWAAAEPHSSFHSARRCAAAWIQSWWGEREQKSSHWHWQWFWDCAENILMRFIVRPPHDISCHWPHDIQVLNCYKCLVLKQLKSRWTDSFKCGYIQWV